jgi:excisionase family DNA binding protein
MNVETQSHPHRTSLPIRQSIAPDSASPEPRWLRLNEAASIARASVPTIRRAIRRGNLRAVRLGDGRSLRTRYDWLLEFMLRREATAWGEA